MTWEKAVRLAILLAGVHRTKYVVRGAIPPAYTQFVGEHMMKSVTL